MKRPVIDRNSFDAAIFDLDGVVTDTAPPHTRAWKQLFDEFLAGTKCHRRGLATAL